METGSFKELYSVSLKATYDMKVGNREFKKGEIVAFFDSIQTSGIAEAMNITAAKGGYATMQRVYWEEPREMRIDFSQGVFNLSQFAIMSNANLIEKAPNSTIILSARENLETDQNKKITLAHTPTEDLFFYDSNGNKITPINSNNKVFTFQQPYMQVLVTYKYEYSNGAEILQLGAPLVSGFLELEGRTRVKDDQTGQVVTGIIKIPKLKLLSNFSIRLGRQSTPVAGKFSAIGIPVGSRGNTYVSEFYVLNDDIDSDI